MANMEPIWLEKVKRALQVIEDASPIIVLRIRRYTRGIWVNPAIGNDYLHDAQLIRILGPSLYNHTAETLALTLAHEATHARIRHRGIPFIPGERARHERVCVRVEARLAARLVDGGELSSRVMQKLETPWWTPEELRSRDLRAIERLTLPEWWRQLLRRRVERRRYH